MPKLTLKKAIATGAIALPKMPLAAMIALDQYGAWVSDERKRSGDPRAVYLVVEVGDDFESADRLRALGLPVVVLQHGWWSRAGAPNYHPEREFSVGAFLFEPIKLRSNRSYGVVERVAPVLSIHAYRWDRRAYAGEYVMRVEMDYAGRVDGPHEGWAPYFNPGVRSPYELGHSGRLAADFRMRFDPDAGTFGPPGNDVSDAAIVELAARMAADGLRRATLNPKGEYR